MLHRNKLAVLALTCLSFANGCSNMNNTQADALGGGALGAVAGALIDHKHPGTGAAVGGVVGAVTGAAVGSAQDADERRVKAAQAIATAPVRGTLTLEEVIDMAHHGIGDPVIIDKIRASGTIYNLSVDHIKWLHDQGVSDAVISEMQRTLLYAPRRAYGDPVYVVPPPRPVIVEPTIGIGYGYYRHWN